MAEKNSLLARHENVEFETCYARLTGNELTIGNSYIERKWKIENGLLYSCSFRDRQLDYEWLGRTSGQPSVYPAIVVAPEEIERINFSTRCGKANPVEAPSLVVDITVIGSSFKFVYKFKIFPAASGVALQLVVENPADQHPELTDLDKLASLASSRAILPDGIEKDKLSIPHAEKKELPAPDILEQFELAAEHIKLTQVILQDQTDQHNELVFEKEWLIHPSETNLQLEGNLFVLENVLTRAGLIFLKHAPLPHARPLKVPHDLIIKKSGQVVSATFHGHGIGSEPGKGYPYIALAYRGGGIGWIEALQTYQRQLRTYDPARDGLFLTNTWGDRSRDSRINQDFLELEMEAAARLGADILQIDDGWQAGITANSVKKGGVWEGFWSADNDFWRPHPLRLPDGLSPLILKARKKGLQLGLWFAPDSTDDFANWQPDADTLISFHQQLGISYFKIDAVKLRSKSGEANLGKFFDKVLEVSEGQVVFDTDVTAEIRPGYFSRMNSGPIFIENRYTDWHNYWPHQTLRNVWKLAHYIDPLHLRIEFLNNSRNTGLYIEDPLAPAAYSPDYLFAITMFTNPLGWFEASNLPAAYFEKLSSLVHTWKSHRQAIAQGKIFPVGDTPDGTKWAGFVSVNEDRDEGYLLFFRELNEQQICLFELPMFSNHVFTAEILWGSGSVKLEGGYATVQIAVPQQILFVHIKAC